MAGRLSSISVSGQTSLHGKFTNKNELHCETFSRKEREERKRVRGKRKRGERWDRDGRGEKAGHRNRDMKVVDVKSH